MSEDVPIHQPYIRVWEIDENSTRYDKLMVAPTDYETRLMWILWSIISLFDLIFAGIVFVGVLSSRKARKNPFNIYLLFLAVPDLFLSFACFLSCLINAIVGYFLSEALCYFQSFYAVFGITANAWINAIIARELYALLRGAKLDLPFQPPSKQKVIWSSLWAYIGSAFVASWGLIRSSWWPFRIGLILGAACVPTDYDTASTIFFYCVYLPALMGIPVMYVTYVCYMIYKDNLMPRRGRRRVLTIYFLRLTAVFVIMWIPAMLCLFIIGAWIPHWAVWAGGAWSHMQGLVSAAVSLFKPDVYNAVRQLLRCRCNEQETEDTDTQGSKKRKKSSSKKNSQNPNTLPSVAKNQHSNCAMSKEGGEKKNHDGDMLPPRSNMSQIGTFSEVVGWKTQVEHVDEEEPDGKGISIGSASQISAFSKMVGWKTQVEAMTDDDSIEDDDVSSSSNQTECLSRYEEVLHQSILPSTFSNDSSWEFEGSANISNE